MKFSILALSAILAFAAAAETSTAEASIITTSPEVECAKKCEAKDICCTAKCYSVPCPSDNQANDTNECVAACPQGTGSPADTQKYADCEQSCYSSHFWGGNGNGNGATATRASTSSTGTGNTASQTSSDSSTTNSSSSSSSSSNDNDSNDSNKNNDNDSSSNSGTATSSGFAQQTDNAAANVKLSASAAGLLGLVVAAFAL